MTQTQMSKLPPTPGIEVKFWKGTKQCDPADADRVYVWLPGACLTFPATKEGREVLIRTLDALAAAVQIGRKMGKEDIRKALA